MLAARFITIKVFPALGLKEVIMITLEPSFLPSIRSMFVLSTRKASFIMSRLPCSTTTWQRLLSSSLCFLNFLYLSSFFTNLGISARNGMLRRPKSALLLIEVSSIFLRKIMPNGTPQPSTSIANIIIITFGETGRGDPLGLIIRRVLPTLIRAANSFSSRF